MATTKKLSTKELAEKLGADPRDVRKWLRAQDLGVGRGGGRYEFTPQQAAKLVKQYQADAAKAEDEEAEAA
jgi:phage terminase Nu1 subunit (DNA packaging protein)